MRGIFPGVVVTFFVPFAQLRADGGARAGAESRAPSRRARPFRRPSIGASRAGPAGAPASGQWGVLAGAVAGVIAVVLAVVGVADVWRRGVPRRAVRGRADQRRASPTGSSRGPAGETVMIGQAALAAIAGVVILIAMEGAICLVMAVPIASPIAVDGIDRRAAAGPPRTAAVVQRTSRCCCWRCRSAPESRPRCPAPRARVVLTAVEVEAPPAVVWQHVVSFSEIRTAAAPGTSAPAWPIRCARASRAPASARCGTASSRPARSSSRLPSGTSRGGWPSTSSRQPPPLHEWSPYSRVYAPHLDGFFRTSHGEFRLIALVADPHAARGTHLVHPRHAAGDVLERDRRHHPARDSPPRARARQRAEQASKAGDRR